MRTFIKILVLISLISLFSGCKKYPENKLWFKDPARTFKGGLITMYTINNVDHMPTIKALYRDFPYNYFGTSIPDVWALPFSYSPDAHTLSSAYGEGSLKFSTKGKDVEISFDPVNVKQGAQNIFIAPSVWKILKLTKDGQLKLQAVINYKIYQIQFN